MNIKMLAEKYGYDTPIFLSQVEFEGITKNNMRQIFARLKEKGLIEQYGRGTYYVPKVAKLLSKSYLDTNLVLSAKYIKSIDGVYGYYAGLTFANQIGLTTQMPQRKEIVTNEESSNGREVKVGNTKVFLRKPRNHVADYNWQELQFLDLLARFNSIGVEMNETTVKTLKKYIKDKKLNRNIINKYIECYPSRVAKLLVTEGLIDEFTFG